ncbi:hypothetical protein F4556_004134 [Kitasatospora gansuensis]|uniref:Uncharacterized protein n=3 Tax=Kitasatospora TaxID=2063 RepID=A0A7W7WJH4_9ACTN|nr:hypothetical protein [Kitasatospora gansuensis]MBB4948599.1 hypothetical protein [Kitasatospora gansuensis]
MSRRRWVRGLLGVVAATVTVELIGWLNRQDGGFVLLRGLHQPGLVFPVVLLALLSAVLLGCEDTWIKVGTSLVAALLLFVSMPFYLMDGFEDPERTKTLAAPDGSGRRLVVEEGAAMIDPLWWVSVESGSGVTARRWKVGYFNGDDYVNGLNEVAWDGPDRVRLVTGDSRVHLIDVGADGRPDRTLSLGR